VYITTVIVYLVPLTLLLFGWREQVVAAKNEVTPGWRYWCTWSALVVATVATLSAMSFWIAWTHSGGSPHGLKPPSGIWVPLREISKWSLAVALVTGILGKGRGRLFVIAVAVSIVAVMFFLIDLEMALE
jgi:hypothetical protein